jgi:hypothetical protein
MRDVLDLTDPTEHHVMVMVLQEAENLRVKRQDAFFEKLGVIIQNAVVKAFGKG